MKPDERRSEQMDCLPESRARASATIFAETFHKTPALVSYRTRCGKADCRCAAGELHGPYWYLRWRDGGKQRCRYVRSDELEAVRGVIEHRRNIERAERIARRSAMADLRGLKRWLTELERDLLW